MSLHLQKHRQSFLARARRFAVLSCLPIIFASTSFAGEVIPANPDNYRELIDTLQAGDTLQLASGTYAAGLPIRGLNGDAQNPITITGPTSGEPAVFLGRSCCNTVQIENSSYVTVRHLKLDGQKIPYVDGVNSRGVSHHITIEDLLIVNHGGSAGPDTEHQQTVGINTKGPAWDWVVRRNTIIDAGTGMYFGDSNGAQPFVRGLIEYNLVIDTLGYNIQIKHQNLRPIPDNIGLPTGNNKTIIRYNVFSKANNASTSTSASAYGARPNLLVGHWPLSGEGTNDVYEIYGNFFYQNPADALFQGEGNIALYDNLFVNRSGKAINIQPHNDKPRRINVFHNTIVATGTGIGVSGANSAFSQLITGNAVFAATPISAAGSVTVRDNVTDTYANAGTYLLNPTLNPGSLDLFPKPNMLRGAAIDMSTLQGFSNANLDFNGLSRDGVLRGAYGGDVKNTGWVPRLDIRPDVALPITPAPVVTFSATPNTIAYGELSMLMWSSTDATSCKGSGNWSNTLAGSGTQSTGALTATSTYTVTCTGPGGSAAASTTVTVQPPVMLLPTLSITASAASVARNSDVTLSWASANTTTCTASSAWSGDKLTTGSEMRNGITSDSTFTLTCSGDGGSVTQSVTVIVEIPLPTVSLTADAASVVYNGSTVLNWSTVDATSCTATGAWNGARPVSGSETLSGLTASGVYTLECTGAGGTSAQSVTITVLPESAPPAKPGGGGALDGLLFACLPALLASGFWRRRISGDGNGRM